MERVNKKHIIAYSVLASALIISIVWIVSVTRRNSRLTIEVTNDYNRALTELVDHVNGIETNLRKSMLVSTPSQLASISNDLFRQSAAAKASLGELPVSEIQLDNTAKFLSQVGDYTYVISQNAIKGQKISEEEFNNLASLAKYASELNRSLDDLLVRVYSGEISLMRDEDGYNRAEAAGSDILADMENVEKSFDEYPSLIYDGPFSEHIENREAAMLKNAKEITRDEAKQCALHFLGDKNISLTFEGETANTPTDAYTFRGKDSDISVSVTKRGGHILYYLNTKDVSKENLDFTAAIEVGEKFLRDHGYTSMTTSYYDKSDGIATINYSYMQDGIVCYSDLVKVKISLESGEVIGFEAHGYLMNHEPRSLSTPKLSADEARGKLSPHLTLRESGLALIPKDSLEEVLCYEFHGNFDGRNYIIYINAENGHEEKILMLIESENGILTQ